MQLTATTLGELIQSLRSNPHSGSDKRKVPRVGLRARAEIQIPETSERVPVWVRDVSSGGVNILSPRYFDHDNQFSLMLSENASDSALCNVCHCRRVGSELFSIGAKFVDYSPKKQRLRM